MMALSMAVAVFPSSIAPFFLMVFLGTFMIFSWVPLSGSWVLFFRTPAFWVLSPLEASVEPFSWVLSWVPFAVSWVPLKISWVPLEA